MKTKDWLGRPIKEYKLVNKDGEIIWREGTKYEVADYALRHNLLIVTKEIK